MYSHACGSQVSWDSAHLSWAPEAALLQVVNLTGCDSLLGLSSIPCVFVLGSRLKGQQCLVTRMMPICITTFQASAYDMSASIPLAKASAKVKGQGDSPILRSWQMFGYVVSLQGSEEL